MIEDIGAFTISRFPIYSKLSQFMPFYCNSTGYIDFPRDKNKERIEYLASRRNEAVSNLLRLYPKIKTIVNIDSYYIQQVYQIRNLMIEYDELSKDREIILGGANWWKDERMIPSRIKYWDSWTTPEGLSMKFGMKGHLKVKSVGGVIIYPRWVWEKVKYDIPSFFPDGCEMNHLCIESGLPVWLSLNSNFFHESPFPKTSFTSRIIKSIRMYKIKKHKDKP